MTWASALIAAIQLAISLLENAKRRNALAEAETQLVAKAAIRLLELTAQGRQLRAAISVLDDPEAEKLWQEMVK